MSITKTKGVFFELPESVWEDLVRLLPNRGERTAFYRKVTYTAIDSGSALELSSKVKEEITCLMEERE